MRRHYGNMGTATANGYETYTCEPGSFPSRTASDQVGTAHILGTVLYEKHHSTHIRMSIPKLL